MKTKLLIPLLMLATLLPIAQGFAGNATLTWTLTDVSPFSTNTSADGRVMTGYGCVKHVASCSGTDSGAAVAVTKEHIVVLPITDIQQYEYVYAYVYPVALGDSVKSIAAHDTAHVYAQLSPDGSTWWDWGRARGGSTADTVFSSTTKAPTWTATIDSAYGVAYGTNSLKNAKYMRIVIDYYNSVGTPGEAGVLDTKYYGIYAYGFKAIRH